MRSLIILIFGCISLSSCQHAREPDSIKRIVICEGIDLDSKKRNDGANFRPCLVITTCRIDSKEDIDRLLDSFKENISASPSESEIKVDFGGLYCLMFDDSNRIIKVVTLSNTCYEIGFLDTDPLFITDNKVFSKDAVRSEPFKYKSFAKNESFYNILLEILKRKKYFENYPDYVDDFVKKEFFYDSYKNQKIDIEDLLVDDD